MASFRKRQGGGETYKVEQTRIAYCFRPGERTSSAR